MRGFAIFLILITAVSSFAQKKTILIFDLENNRVDSITNLTYDTTIREDKTTYYIGAFDDNVELLEQEAPVANIYPGSRFTRKKKASSAYDLMKFPVRTSIKMYYKKNDTLNDLCSGSMVSRRHVLTAAHCVSAINSSTPSYDSIYVCPVVDNGMSNNSFPCTWVRKIFIFKGWNIVGDDFALLQLNDPVGDLTGWISIGFNAADSSLKKGIWYKFSYPAFTILSIDSTEYNGDTLYYNYGEVSLLNKNFIGIEYASGIQGESGSSIIKIDNGHEYTSYGVLTFSGNLMHSRLNNWSYYGLESVIHNDLVYGLREEMAENSVTIFPNPSESKVWIKQHAAGVITTLAICDIYGRQVLNTPAPDLSSFIDVSALSEGIYILILKTDRSRIIRKLLIQRS